MTLATLTEEDELKIKKDILSTLELLQKWHPRIEQLTAFSSKLASEFKKDPTQKVNATVVAGLCFLEALGKYNNILMELSLSKQRETANEEDMN